MVKEGLTVKKLAAMLTEKTGKNYTQQSLQHKIFLRSLRYDEMEEFTKLLGYKISIDKLK